MSLTSHKPKMEADLHTLLTQIESKQGSYGAPIDKRKDLLEPIYERNGWTPGCKGIDKQGTCRLHQLMDSVLRSYTAQGLLEKVGYNLLALTKAGSRHFTTQDPFDADTSPPAPLDDSVPSPVKLPLPTPEKIILDTVSVVVPEVPNPLTASEQEHSIRATPCFGKYDPRVPACVYCLLRSACFTAVISSLKQEPKPVSNHTKKVQWGIGESSREVPCSHCHQIIKVSEQVAIPYESPTTEFLHFRCYESLEDK